VTAADAADDAVAAPALAAPGRARRTAAHLLGAIGEHMPEALLPVLLTLVPGVDPRLGVGLAEAAAGMAVGSAREATEARLRRRVHGHVEGAVPLAVSGIVGAVLGAVTATWQAVAIRGTSAGLGALDDPGHRARRIDAVAAGRVAAPMVGAVLFLAVGIKTALFLAAVPAAIALIVALSTSRDDDTPPPPALPRLRLRQRLHLALRLRSLAVAVVAFELGNVAITLLVVRVITLVSQTGWGSRGAAAIALVLLSLHAGAAVAAGWLMRRIGSDTARTTALGAALVLALVAYLAVALVGSAVVAGAGVVGAGAALGAIRRGEVDLLGSHVGGAEHEPALALLATVQVAGAAVASAVTGILWSVVSLRAAAIYLGVCLGIAIVAVVLLRRSVGRLAAA
jgi:hypothetical protein